MYLIEQRENYHVHALFPDPVFVKKIDYTDKEFEELKKLPLCNNTKNFKSVNYSVIELPQFKTLKTKIEECVNDFVDFLNYDVKLKITLSWLNVSKKGNSHHLHNHANSVLSGVMYFSDDDDPMPEIVFKKYDGKTVWQFVNNDGWHWGNTSEMQFSPIRGDLILFPSYMFHSVNENPTDKPRYSIAFNTFPCSDFGNVNRLNKVEL